jgi:hypothetical protein
VLVLFDIVKICYYNKTLHSQEQHRFLHDALVLLLDSHTSVKALLANDATVQDDSPDKISQTAE